MLCLRLERVRRAGVGDLLLRVDPRRRPDAAAGEPVVRLLRRMDRPGLANQRAGGGVEEVHRALERVAVRLVAELGRAARDAQEHHAVEDDGAGEDVRARLGVDRLARPGERARLLVEGDHVGPDAGRAGRAALALLGPRDADVDPAVADRNRPRGGAAVGQLRLPDEGAGIGVHREHPAAVGGDIRAAVGDDRGAGDVALAAGLGGGEGPGRGEERDVGGRDDPLVRLAARVRQVVAVGRPVAARRRRLAAAGRGVRRRRRGAERRHRDRGRSDKEAQPQGDHGPSLSPLSTSRRVRAPGAMCDASGADSRSVPSWLM